MGICVKEILDRRQLNEFIEFPMLLYKDCPNWVPAIRQSEVRILGRKNKNLSEFCQFRLFMAFMDGKPCGRIAGIVNSKANEVEGVETVRFGWLDMVNDLSVLEALVSSVSEWGLKLGCTHIKGPLGFTDMDRMGILVEGFENMSSFNCSYNYPYYESLLEKAGFEKEMDWIQRKINISQTRPKIFRHTKTISQLYGIQIARNDNMFQIANKYGMKVFDVYNKAFAHLYSFSPITPEQARSYTKSYAPILDSRFVSICLDNSGEPVGFIVCVPSLSKAIKSSSGRLYPDGLIRILKTLMTNQEKSVEALIMGVLPEYWGKGAVLLMLEQLYENFISKGINQIILNPQQEQNKEAINMFRHFDTTMLSRRRVYVKKLAQ